MSKAFEKASNLMRLIGKPFRVRRSKYEPHQNKRECARRVRQGKVENFTGTVYEQRPEIVVSDELTIRELPEETDPAGG